MRTGEYTSAQLMLLPYVLSDRIQEVRDSAVRRDNWVVLVVIAIALVVAVGLGVAWWITCQNKGLYPALDQPSWKEGGTWKAYCKP